MEKNYIIKSVVAKSGMDWKVLGYSINYHHKSFPESVQSQFYSVEDMKNYWYSNETQVLDLRWKEIAIKKELVFK